MKVKKGVKNILIILLITVILALFCMGGYLVYKEFFTKGPSSQTKVIVNTIKDYNYELEKDAPKEYKKMFDELDKLLKKDEVDEEEYAKLVARMFVFDFYNIDNKMSKNDIGGTQFVLESYIDNFILQASETTYKYVEHNIYGDRKQKLPIVSSVEIIEIKTEKYSYKKINDPNAFKIDLKIKYDNTIEGYPTEVTVKLVHTSIGNEENTKQKLEVYYMK